MFFLYPFNPFLLFTKESDKGNFIARIYDDALHFNNGCFIKNPTLLFYYNQKFYVIERGNSYNKFNAIIGFLTKSIFSCILTYILIAISLASLLVLSKPSFILAVSFVGVVIFMIFLFLTMINQIDYNKSFKKLYNEN
jgi:hypothetical protein